MTLAEIKAAIDTAITNQTAVGSVSQTAVGAQMKNVAQFASDNFVPLELTGETIIDIGENHLKISATSDSANQLDVEFYDEGITSKSTDNTDPDHPIWSAWYQTKEHQRFFTQRSDLTSANDVYVFCEQDRVELGYEDQVNAVLLKVKESGVEITDSINQLGLVDAADYSANGKQNPLWKATWGAVTGLFASGSVQLVDGQAVVNSPLASVNARDISLRYSLLNGSMGFLIAEDDNINEGVSFTIRSVNSDFSTNTADTSTVKWCIIGA